MRISGVSVLVKAPVFARQPPVEWGNIFSSLKGVLIFTPGGLKSVPLPELHVVTGPGTQGEMLREFWNAAQAYRQHADLTVNMPPSSGDCPMPNFFYRVAGFEGQFAESSSMVLGHSREAQMLRLGEENAFLGGPTKRLKKLDETLVAVIWLQAGRSTFLCGPT